MDATATPHSAAAALLEFMAELPLLLPADKKAVLKLLQGLDPSGFDLIARSGHGISVFRTAACSSSNTDIYRVTGMGEVEAEGRVSAAARNRQVAWCDGCCQAARRLPPAVPAHDRCCFVCEHSSPNLFACMFPFAASACSLCLSCCATCHSSPSGTCCSSLAAT